MGTPVLARCSLRLSWAMLAISSSSSRLTLRSLSSRRPRPTRNLCASSYSTAGSGAWRECKKSLPAPPLGAELGDDLRHSVGGVGVEVRVEARPGLLAQRPQLALVEQRARPEHGRVEDFDALVQHQWQREHFAVRPHLGLLGLIHC